ncbi:MAG: hypothetical protein JWO60_2381, partial [Frankiales bacterium]|nr:hypothetical protein [Frankiales bacterium]
MNAPGSRSQGIRSQGSRSQGSASPGPASQVVTAEARLDPVATSPGAARRLVRAALAEAGRS